MVRDEARHVKLHQQWRTVRGAVLEAARKHQTRDRDHLTSLLASCTDEFDEGLLSCYVALLQLAWCKQSDSNIVET